MCLKWAAFFKNYNMKKMDHQVRDKKIYTQAKHV